MRLLAGGLLAELICVRLGWLVGSIAPCGGLDCDTAVLNHFVGLGDDIALQPDLASNFKPQHCWLG